MGAWLITWEWLADYAKFENEATVILKSRFPDETVREIIELLYVNNNVAAILNYRLSGYTVREFVERLYINNYGSLSQRVAYAKNKKNNPYPAQPHSINGVPWLDRIICGHNPELYARLVDDIRVHIDENGKEVLTWKERPMPEHLQKMLKDSRAKPE